MSKHDRPARPIRLLCLLVVLGLLVTACSGGGDDDPTSTIEPAVAVDTATVEQATPAPTIEPATATPSPEPEPSATLTRSVPAPTVAVPIQRTPTPVPPNPTPESEPTQDVPSGDTGVPTIGDLLLESDLSDWEQVEFEYGTGFVADGSYHINVTESDGSFIILRSNQTDFADILVTLDMRMLTASVDSRACVTARADYNYQYNYAMCVTGAGETYAIYEYFDLNGTYHLETLFETTIREGVNPATEWNNLSIIAFGEEIGFFVNDTFLGLATHSGPPAGSVGFYVENYDPNGVEFEFANLWVWAVEADDITAQYKSSTSLP